MSGFSKFNPFNEAIQQPTLIKPLITNQNIFEGIYVFIY